MTSNQPTQPRHGIGTSSRLPPELWLEIFDYSDYAALRTILRVCRTFNNIISWATSRSSESQAGSSSDSILPPGRRLDILLFRAARPSAVIKNPSTATGINAGSANTWDNMQIPELNPSVIKTKSGTLELEHNILTFTLNGRGGLGQLRRRTENMIISLLHSIKGNSHMSTLNENVTSPPVERLLVKYDLTGLCTPIGKMVGITAERSRGVTIAEVAVAAMILTQGYWNKIESPPKLRERIVDTVEFWQKHYYTKPEDREIGVFPDWVDRTALPERITCGDAVKEIEKARRNDNRIVLKSNPDWWFAREVHAQGS